MKPLKHVVGTAIPFIILIIYLLLFVFIQGKIPDAHALLASLETLYKTHGYALIFLAGLLEGMFVIGFYVPGSAVMLLGSALSATGVLSFPLSFFSGLAGLSISFAINYALGRFGWYHALAKLGLEPGMKTAKQKLEKYGVKAIFIGYLYPGSAAMLSTAAGILRMPFKQFIIASIIAQAFWGLCWGALAYFYGVTIIDFIMQYFLVAVFVVLVIWGVYKLSRWV